MFPETHSKGTFFISIHSHNLNFNPPKILIPACG